MNRIGQIALSVADPDRAEASYGHTLGLAKLFRFGTLVFFDGAGVRLMLEGRAKPVQPAAGACHYFRVDSIDDSVAELKGRGLRFEDHPHRIARMPDDELWMTFFRDPDGHLLALMGLAELGYLEGKSIVIEESYADGDPQRLAQLAHQIVESRPDIIVTIAASATAAARQATSTIPIVMAHTGDPVGAGWVASMANRVATLRARRRWFRSLDSSRSSSSASWFPGWRGWECSPTRRTPGHPRCLRTCVRRRAGSTSAFR